MNNLQKASMYTHIQWTKKEEKRLSKIFLELEEIMLDCAVREDDFEAQQKAKALAPVYDIVHSIVLDLNIRQMVKGIKKEYQKNEKR